MNANEQRTPEEEAFCREWKNKPLTAEEIEFYKNPGELIPMDQVISELEVVLQHKRIVKKSS